MPEQSTIRSTRDVLYVVALSSASGSYGGPFSSALEGCRLLNEAGLDSGVLAGYLEDDEPLPDPLVTVRRVRPLVRRLRFPSLFSLSILTTLVGQIRTSRCVHVAFCRELVPFLAALMAWALRRPMILQPHGMLTVGRESAARRIFDRVLVAPVARRASAVVALTAREKGDLVARFGIAPDTIRVIGNPVDLDADPFRDFAQPRSLPDRPEVLFCARLHPRKRVHDFVAAAGLARVGTSRWTVLGPDGGDLELVLDAIRDGNPVAYAGSVPPGDVATRVSAASVFVLCSEREPWGIVLASALALGLPAVVTRSADLAVVIESYGAGTVVPDADPVAIARAVEALTSDDEKFASCSTNARRLAHEVFSRETLGPDAVALAREMVALRP